MYTVKDVSYLPVTPVTWLIDRFSSEQLAQVGQQL